jgi:hypothetical protein
MWLLWKVRFLGQESSPPSAHNLFFLPLPLLYSDLAWKTVHSHLVIRSQRKRFGLASIARPSTSRSAAKLRNPSAPNSTTSTTSLICRRKTLPERRLTTYDTGNRLNKASGPTKVGDSHTDQGPQRLNEGPRNLAWKPSAFPSTVRVNLRQQALLCPLWCNPCAKTCKNHRVCEVTCGFTFSV